MNRDAILERYLRQATVLTEELRIMPDDILDYRPEGSDGPTIRELFISLLAEEMEGFILLNPAVLEAAGVAAGPGAPPGAAEADGGADAEIDSDTVDGTQLEESLDEFMAIRELVFDWLSEPDDGRDQAGLAVRLPDGIVARLPLEECVGMLAARLDRIHDEVEKLINAYGPAN